MRRSRLFVLVGIAVILTLVGLTTSQTARAGFIGFQGEPTDNFWTLSTRYCRDGLSISAVQTQLSIQKLSFSVQLGSSSPAVQTALPFPIVQGDGSVLVNNSHSFIYQIPQIPGAPTKITVERWDHGNQRPDPVTGGEPGENSDGSVGDDIVSEPNTPAVEDCLTGARITQSVLTCSGFTASGTAVLPNGYAGVRVWNAVTGVALIDSSVNTGAPTVYAPISANDTYSFSAGFVAQPPGTALQARVYWAPLATFGSWDGGHFDDITVNCQLPEALPFMER